MKTQQNGPMSHEQVRKIFSDLRSQLDKLEELFLEVAVMQNARWDFPEGNYSVLATWLLYDPMAHMLFPVAEKERVTEVGHWWDKSGENEIDLIAVEKLDKRVTIGEVKRNEKKISMQTLEEKFVNIRSHFRGYQIQFVALSLGDM